MAIRMQLRRDSLFSWNTKDPILSEGEIGIETDSIPYKFKIGNGILNWKQLPYSGSTSSSGISNLLQLSDFPDTYSGMSGRLLAVNSTEDGLEFVNTNGSMDIDNVKFAKVFGIECINKSNSKINGNTFVSLYPTSDNKFGIVELNKQIGYEGQLFGYVRNDVSSNSEGFVELITVIQTNSGGIIQSGTRTYIGFSSADIDNDKIKIGDESDLNKVFGSCGVYGEKNSTTNEYLSTFNVFETQASYHARYLGSENVKYIEYKPPFSFDSDVESLYSVITIDGTNQTIVEDLPKIKDVRKGYKIYITIKNTDPTNKIKLRPQGVDNLQNQINTDIEFTGDGFKGYFLLTDNGWEFIDFASGSGGLSKSQIEVEFATQLHTFQDLQNYGFENVSIYYGELNNTTPLPTEANSWIQGRMLINRDLHLGISNNSSQHFGFVVPLSIEPLLSDLIINDNSESYTVSDYIKDGLKYKLLITNNTFDTAQPISIKFDLDVIKPSNQDNDETFHYVTGISDVSIPTDRDNIFMDMSPLGGDILQNIPNIHTFNRNGTRIIVRNYGDNHDVILKAKSYQSIDGVNEYHVKPKENVEFLVDKSNVRLRVLSDSNDNIRKDNLSWGVYGWDSTLSSPSDDSWIEGMFSLLKSTTTPRTELGSMFYKVMIPIEISPLFNAIIVDNVEYSVISSDYDYNGNKYKLFSITTPIDMSSQHELSVKWEILKSSPIHEGFTIKDGNTTATQVQTINLIGSSVEVNQNNNHDVSIFNYMQLTDLTKTESDEGNNVNVYSDKISDLNVKYPLRAYNNDDKEKSAIIDIDPLSYEYKHNECYLSFLLKETPLKSIDNGTTDPKGYLWFDDVIYGRTSTQIQSYKPYKVYRVSEYVEVSPNIVGANDYYIGFKLSSQTKAKKHGTVTISLIDSNTNKIVVDSNGNNLTNSITINKDVTVGSVMLDGVVSLAGKNATDYKFYVESTCGDIIIAGRDNGGTGIIIQSLSNDEKTSPAFLQWIEDTGRNPIITTTKIQNDFITFPSIESLKADGLTDTKTYPAKYNVHTIDGFSLYSDKEFVVKYDSDTFYMDNSPFITLSTEIDSSQTVLLRGSKVKVEAKIKPYESDWFLILAKWGGSPDEMTYPIINTVDSNGVMQYSSSWSQVDSLEIPKTNAQDLVDVEHIFTIPNDANNISFIIAPKTYSSVPLKSFGIKELTVSPVNGVSTIYNIDHKTYHDIGYLNVTQNINNSNSVVSTIPIKSTPTEIPIDVQGTTHVIRGNAPIHKSGNYCTFEFNESGMAFFNVTLPLKSSKNGGNVRFYAELYDNNDKSLGQIPSSRRLLGLPNADEPVVKNIDFIVDMIKGQHVKLYCHNDKDDVTQILYIKGETGYPNTGVNVNILYFPPHSGMSSYNQSSSPSIGNDPVDDAFIEQENLFIQNYGSDFSSYTNKYSFSLKGTSLGTSVLLTGIDFSKLSDNSFPHIVNIYVKDSSGNPNVVSTFSQRFNIASKTMDISFNDGVSVGSEYIIFGEIWE